MTKGQDSQKVEEKEREKIKQEENVAVIRVRSASHATSKVKSTLEMLKLYNKNTCVIYPKTPSIIGMVKKIENYVTFGEIDVETIKLLTEKRGKVDKKDKSDKTKFFRLHPPRGGFERKGIKKPFSEGGVLGYRGNKIAELIRRMI